MVDDSSDKAPTGASPAGLPVYCWERVRYAIRAEREGHPAGTECWAERDRETKRIRLTFDDGSVVELPKRFHIEGFETRTVDDYGLAY